MKQGESLNGSTPLPPGQRPIDLIAGGQPHRSRRLAGDRPNPETFLTCFLPPRAELETRGATQQGNLSPKRKRSFFLKKVLPSLHRTQIAVQPVESLLDQFGPWNVVAGFVLNAALVFFGRTQEAEHRELRGFHGVEEIETAIQH